MLFLGSTFASGLYTVDATPTFTEDIDTIRCYGCIVDELYVTKDPTVDFDDSSKIWNYNTTLYAKFQDNLLAGNLETTLSLISKLRIKQRIKGTLLWRTIVEYDVNSEEDLNHVFTYKYARGGKTEYEFCIVFVLNDNVEGNPSGNTSAISEFEGAYLIDADAMYHLYLDMIITQKRNCKSEIKNPLGRKYPLVMRNGISKYDSGTAKSTFIQYNQSTDEYDVDNMYLYNENVNEFLTNSLPKILKTDEGKIWLVSIYDSIEQDNKMDYLYPETTFNWVETGNYKNTTDLYNAGLSDVDIEGE